MFPPGRLRLATTPNPTGSAPRLKTMGIVVVAALAASTAGAPPPETITLTCWRNGAADAALRNPITGIAGCCARAASGHAAAPPRSVMNWRRLRAGMGFQPSTEKFAGPWVNPDQPSLQHSTA